MHGAQFGRRQHGVGIALIRLDFIINAQFFQHPEHALRARIVEVMNNEHGGLPLGLKSGAQTRKEYNMAECARSRSH
jgi:hypothetical protein